MVQLLLEAEYVVLLFGPRPLAQSVLLQLQVSRHLQNAIEMREVAAPVFASHSFDAVTLKSRQSPLGKAWLKCGE